MKDTELKDLRYFCLAAELGSITRAAETLGVSQPFVTKVINRLEEELGTQLFDINKRRIVLNTNCRRTKVDHAFGVVGLSYNKFRPFTASMKEFKHFAVGFFAELQKLIYAV